MTHHNAIAEDHHGAFKVIEEALIDGLKRQVANTERITGRKPESTKFEIALAKLRALQEAVPDALDCNTFYTDDRGHNYVNFIDLEFTVDAARILAEAAGAG